MGIQIKAIEIYHPEYVRDNTYYIEHFKNRGKDVTHLIEDVLGRKQRYLIQNKEENTITLASKAAKKVLEACHMQGSDIDMIVFSTQLPEYISPPGAARILKAIEGKSEAFCYDLNANCVGMVFALEQCYAQMQVNKKLKNILLVGCDLPNLFVSPEDSMYYGCFGDAACALIIERTEETVASEIVESIYYANSTQSDQIMFPPYGFSHLAETKPQELFFKFEAVNVNLPEVKARIQKIMADNGLTQDEISMFCFSQYVYRNIEWLRSELQISEEKSHYVGDRYGYTGTTSPFMVLYEALKAGKIKRGDYVLFWTLGAATQHMILLMKY